MKKLKPICDSCPSGEFNAIFDSINDKQRVHQAGRMSNFYNFLIIDNNNKPIWNPDKQDYMFAGVQANTPSVGRYRHAKVNVLPRILTPSQFLNIQDNSMVLMYMISLLWKCYWKLLMKINYLGELELSTKI